MKFPRIWLRSETKIGEARTPIVPAHVQKLVEAGVSVFVERSPQRIFPDQEYEFAGATLVSPHDWPKVRDALILGLKELPDSQDPLIGTHAFFAHAYRNQPDSQGTLNRFKSGDGFLYDLEFLTDARGVRIAAFGYRAGYMGAALGLIFYLNPRARELSPFASENILWKTCADLLAKNRRPLSILITGSQGRCGGGAKQFFLDLKTHCGDSLADFNLNLWDLNETKNATPSDYTRHDLWIHAIGGQKIGAEFLTQAQYLQTAAPRLRTLVDVTCDIGTPFHRVPIIDQSTDLKNPVRLLLHPSGCALQKIAIDHLPTLLPRESSEEFSQLLLPYLLPNGEETPWINAARKFSEVMANV